jgi:hypothetical protein
MLQMFFAGVLLVLIGILTCLAVATDPNVEPNPRRQRLLPVGLAMLFAGVVASGSIVGFDYLGESLGSDGDLSILGSVAVFGGYGLSVIAAGTIGFLIGRQRNRKLNSGTHERRIEEREQFTER